MRGTKFRTRLAAGAVVLALATGAPVAYAALDDAGGGGPVVLDGQGERFAETRLFFGTELPDGGEPVTDEEFREFVDREVTPRFPDGLTVQQGWGQWRDRHGTIENERSYELTLLYPGADAGMLSAEIEQIRKSYRHEFGQESVGRADDWVRVSF
jgi:hypothetical protein